VSAPIHSGANVLAPYWAVIPAYNEAVTIRDVVERAIGQIEHVIVVDDGSTDGMAEALVGLPITLLRNHTNCGKAASLWRGLSRHWLPEPLES
jgi:glycosyltransferase involved in cell wall biosynthesis